MDLQDIQRAVLRREPRLRSEGVDLVSAVLLPLVRREGEWRLIFEIRNLQLKRQPGEICFPGGAIEPGDPTPQDAAVRECCEELGLSAEEVSVIAPLDPFVSGSHVLIHPFLGHLARDPELTPDPDEIEELLEVPLDFFLATPPEIHQVETVIQPLPGFPLDRVPEVYGSDWGRKRVSVYFYQFGEHTIWGLSARVLVDLVGRITA
jgi:coenzyme A diphosphatase NUDT7